VHLASLEMAIPSLYFESQSEYFRVLIDWLVRALKEVSPKVALKRVAPRWSLIAKRAGEPKQLARWRRLRAKHSKQIQDALVDL
jgi:multiple sugar transport system substrate-binding protein